MARCMVPIGEVQIGMSHVEKVELLRRKMKKFMEEDIRKKFRLE